MHHSRETTAKFWVSFAALTETKVFRWSLFLVGHLSGCIFQSLYPIIFVMGAARNPVSSMSHLKALVTVEKCFWHQSVFLSLALCLKTNWPWMEGGGSGALCCVLQGSVWHQVFALSALRLWVFHFFFFFPWSSKLLRLQNQELKLGRMTTQDDRCVRIPS